MSNTSESYTPITSDEVYAACSEIIGCGFDMHIREMRTLPTLVKMAAIEAFIKQLTGPAVDTIRQALINLDSEGKF
ncbi:MAG: hypothetical protein PVI90_00460 [Desulfobacteraceae bacterium]|jgi:hypothetical protein